MKQLTNRALATAFALVLIAGSASAALADKDKDKGKHVHGNAANAHAKVVTRVDNDSRVKVDNDNDNDADKKVKRSHGKSAMAQSCINPAGNMRGWCKSHMNGAFIMGTVTGINSDHTAIVTLANGQEVQINTGDRHLVVGQQVTLRGNFGNGNVFVPVGGNYKNFGGPFSGASVRGLIVSVNGNSIQIAQGLNLITINDANAASRGAISGSLFPGRTITAAGNWNGNIFYANSIQ
ncbi:MAG TPA: hypothetical protein VFO29_03900 [Candidatus Rubrimentiphilum sp.]|nr:hypothetical protein [Candidatus Rubrimentiphilum sp.]